jgi:hypothetical protein
MTKVQTPAVAALSVPKTTSRRFTRKLVVWNCSMAWMVIVAVSWLAPGVSATVVPACVAVIT